MASSWSDVTKDQVVIELNSDFNTPRLPTTEITAVLKAWQNGAMSWNSVIPQLPRLFAENGRRIGRRNFEVEEIGNSCGQG